MPEATFQNLSYWFWGFYLITSQNFWNPKYRNKCPEVGIS